MESNGHCSSGAIAYVCCDSVLLGARNHGAGTPVGAQRRNCPITAKAQRHKGVMRPLASLHLGGSLHCAVRITYRRHISKDVT
jgi:hypothetical protein